MSDTAPQPPPVTKKRGKNIEDAIGVVFNQRDRIAALEAQLTSLQQANVMARDIADQAHQRAEKAERELAEAQERLSMAEQTKLDILNDLAVAVEALEKVPHERYCESMKRANVPEEMCSCLPDSLRKKSRKALSATAEAVAQHTAEVERRGAAKELRRISATSIHTITLYPNASGPGKGHRLVLCEALEARAAELEGA